MPEDMNDLIRRAAGHEPAESVKRAEAPKPTSFDGGARTPPPSAPPSAGEAMRAAWRAYRRQRSVQDIDFWPQDTDPS